MADAKRDGSAISPKPAVKSHFHGDSNITKWYMTVRYEYETGDSEAHDLNIR